MAKQALTPTQKGRRIKYAAILKFIAQHAAQYGVPPTIAELSKAFGSANRSTGDRWLQYLQNHGYIERTKPGKPRAYKITNSGIHYMNRYYDPGITWTVGESIDVR